jgi:2,4-dienoyl-CoA reductase-like NADH-dependent reductase (Old Yellow Enzyme family)
VVFLNDRCVFNFSSLDELENKVKELQLDIPFSTNIDVLKEKIEINGKTINNRLAIHPMEGCDATLEGSPSELTERRYMRYTKGLAGLIWFEATAVSESARANNRQLFLNADTFDDFAKLINMMKEESIKNSNQPPYLVLQLAHSGRFGENKVIAVHDKKLDKISKIERSHPIITDKELEELKESYVKTAELAKKAGFDAVDVKSCHRYLLSELLGARTREGKYGGNYENRTSFLKDVVKKIKDEIGIEVTVRLNISDFLHYPIGWGINEQGELDLTEPLKLISELQDTGVKLINITAGSPYINPHINRPADGEAKKYTPPEPPLIGVERLIKLSKEIQNNFTDLIVVGTGFSWFREYVTYVASGMVEKGYAKIIGLGRMAFAYPDFAKDIIEKGRLDKNKVCITCVRCAELKAHKKITGCVIRDKDIYLKPYLEILRENK